MPLRAAQALAERVLLHWCLSDDSAELMEGETWDAHCTLAGVDPVLFSSMVVEIRSRMSATEREQRRRILARERSNKDGAALAHERWAA